MTFAWPSALISSMPLAGMKPDLRPYSDVVGSSLDSVRAACARIAVGVEAVIYSNLVGVRARTAIERVVAGTADQHVVTHAAVQSVGARAAIERVVAKPTVQRIVPGTSEDGVVSGRAGDRVGAAAAIDGDDAGQDGLREVQCVRCRAALMVTSAWPSALISSMPLAGPNPDLRPIAMKAAMAMIRSVPRVPESE